MNIISYFDQKVAWLDMSIRCKGYYALVLSRLMLSDIIIVTISLAKVPIN